MPRIALLFSPFDIEATLARFPRLGLYLSSSVDLASFSESPKLRFLRVPCAGGKRRVRLTVEEQKERKQRNAVIVLAHLRHEAHASVANLFVSFRPAEIRSFVTIATRLLITRLLVRVSANAQALHRLIAQQAPLDHAHLAVPEGGGFPGISELVLQGAEHLLGDVLVI